MARASVMGLSPKEEILKLRSYIEAEFGTVKEAFRRIDINGNGRLSAVEFRDGMRKAGYTRDAVKVFQLLDFDEGGTLDAAEFCAGVARWEATADDDVAATVGAAEGSGGGKRGSVKFQAPFTVYGAWDRKSLSDLKRESILGADRFSPESLMADASASPAETGSHARRHTTLLHERLQKEDSLLRSAKFKEQALRRMSSTTDFGRAPNRNEDKLMAPASMRTRSLPPTPMADGAATASYCIGGERVRPWPPGPDPKYPLRGRVHPMYYRWRGKQETMNSLRVSENLQFSFEALARDYEQAQKGLERSHKEAVRRRKEIEELRAKAEADYEAIVGKHRQETDTRIGELRDQRRKSMVRIQELAEMMKPQPELPKLLAFIDERFHGDVASCFACMDLNANKRLSSSEFQEGLRSVGFFGEGVKLFGELDMDKNGDVSLNEMLRNLSRPA